MRLEIREVNWMIDAVVFARSGEMLVVLEFIWLPEAVIVGPLGRYK